MYPETPLSSRKALQKQMFRSVLPREWHFGCCHCSRVAQPRQCRAPHIPSLQALLLGCCEEHIPRFPQNELLGSAVMIFHVPWVTLGSWEHLDLHSSPDLLRKNPLSLIFLLSQAAVCFNLQRLFPVFPIKV